MTVLDDLADEDGCGRDGTDRCTANVNLVQEIALVTRVKRVGKGFAEDVVADVTLEPGTSGLYRDVTAIVSPRSSRKSPPAVLQSIAPESLIASP